MGRAAIAPFAVRVDSIAKSMSPILFDKSAKVMLLIIGTYPKSFCKTFMRHEPPS
jgi:hypothetical protein